MRKLTILVILAFVASLFTTGVATANPSIPPVAPVGSPAPAPTTVHMQNDVVQTESATCNTSQWQLRYGGTGLGTHQVSSDRQPAWHVWTASVLTNGVCQGANLYLFSTGEAICTVDNNYVQQSRWTLPTYGTVSTPAALWWPDDGNMNEKNSSNQTVWKAFPGGSLLPDYYMVKLDSNCFLEYWVYDGGQWLWRGNGSQMVNYPRS